MVNAKDIKDIIAELHKDGRIKIITLIDGNTYTDGLQGNAIVFDQDELIAHSFSINNIGISTSVQKRNPYIITSFKYDKISSIKTIITEDGFNEVIEKLLSDGVISEEKKQGLLKTMDLKEVYAKLDPLK